MGYTQDTHMSQFIPVGAFQTAGTCVLTHSVASNLVKAARTANDTAFSLWIPIPLPCNDSPLKGARLKSIDVYYLVGTADLTSFAAPVLQKTTLKADAAAPTGSEVPTTYSCANAATLTQAQHKVTVTVTTPEWADDDSAYFLDLEIDPAASTVFTLYGARANYDLPRVIFLLFKPSEGLHPIFGVHLRNSYPSTTSENAMLEEPQPPRTPAAPPPPAVPAAQPENSMLLLKSRKFWAALIGLILIVLRVSARISRSRMTRSPVLWWSWLVISWELPSKTTAALSSRRLVVLLVLAGPPEATPEGPGPRAGQHRHHRWCCTGGPRAGVIFNPGSSSSGHQSLFLSLSSSPCPFVSFVSFVVQNLLLERKYPMSLTRTPAAIAANIAINTAKSSVISMADYSGGLLQTPAAWTAASIAFKVCDTPDGTFVPLRDQAANLVEITDVVANAAAAYPLPDELFGALYFKIWSETDGSDTNQQAARALTITLKG